MTNGPDPGAGAFGPPPQGPPTIDPRTGRLEPPPIGDPSIGLPPPTGTPWGWAAPDVSSGDGDGRRPWWGLGDVLLAVPFIVVTTVLATVVWAVIAAVDGSLDLDGLTSSETNLPASLFAASLIGQQVGQGLWPWIVSKWKGLGMASDWGWGFEWRDLLIGPATALGTIVLAVITGAIVAELVGVSTEVSNTGFLDDAEGTAAYWILILGVAIGAPITEELLFRGLVLRAIEKRAGTVAAVIGSTIAFTLPHYISSSPAELAVLLATIGTVGLVLGAVAAYTRRLAPVIIAHVLFNSLTVIQLLAG